MKIYDFNDAKSSGLIYGGSNDEWKLGILLDNEPWMLKVPKKIKGSSNKEVRCSTAPVSEYLGSHIFDLLGFDVQETKLGVRDNIVVVACRDFRDDETELCDYFKIKNHYSLQIAQELKKIGIFNDCTYQTNMETALIYFQHHPLFKSLSNLENHFWKMSVVDILINNNDRNSWNWGILQNRHKKQTSIVPVYDNDQAFYNNLSEKICFDYLQSKEYCKKASLDGTLAYFLNNQHISFAEFLSLDNPRLKDAIQELIPIIASKINDINSLIDDIPDEYNELPILGPCTKEFYKQSMMYRFTELLYPRYLELCKEKQSNEMYL